MFCWVPLALTRVKTILVPSGDQPGEKQETDLGSDKAPPQAGMIGSWCRPLPSARTTQIARRWLGSMRVANRILFPLGDQLGPGSLSVTKSGGVICRNLLPSSLTTKRPTGPLSFERTKTMRFPSGEKSPGSSSPPGLDVILVRPPPSEERIV